MPEPRFWRCKECGAGFSRAERRDYHKRETGHRTFDVSQRPKLTNAELTQEVRPED